MSKTTMELVLWASIAVCAAGAAPAETWIDATYDDFAAGRFDDQGQNAYVSKSGAIRTIHRFDLDQDGHIDLFFPNTHDRRQFVPPALATVGQGREVSHEKLAVDGSQATVIADLNKDGHLDLVFCPNASGVQHPRRFITIIWGCEDGWPASRANGVLPAHGAKDVEVVDLNADGWPDIAVLNSEAWLPGQPEGNILRVYWGGENGYILNDRLELGVAQALDLDAADIDGDGASDLAVLRGNGTVQIFWPRKGLSGIKAEDISLITLPGAGARTIELLDYNTDSFMDIAAATDRDAVLLVTGASERAWGKKEAVPAFPATQMASGDLDGDGFPELVLTNAAVTRAAGGEAGALEAGQGGQVRILWGSRDGFDKARSTALSAPNAYAAAAGDLDGDGNQDLALAIYQGEARSTTESIVYFGKGDRTFVRGEEGFPTAGATHAAIIPAGDGQPGRIVFANSVDTTLNERVPNEIVWGGPDGFDKRERLTIPFISGYEGTAADLNEDGYADLVTLASGHGGDLSAKETGANIFWGGPDGFDPNFGERRTILREMNTANSNVADLDKDGYLDLVLGAIGPPEPGKPALLTIYYGGEDGYNRDRRVALESESRASICAIGDFNRDEWLDIAVTDFEVDRVRIFHGSPDGFQQDNQSSIASTAPIAMDTADLNADGYLDLVVGSYYDPISGNHDTGSTIYWGGEQGFQEWNAQWLPGMTPLGITIADFDNDGHLDIFSPHYHSQLTRESLPNYLFWGGPDGFDAQRRTDLIGDSGSDALAGDFNKDGRLDIALVCHASDGDHHTKSIVFYNDGNRFADPRKEYIPTGGPHWMWTEDMGHIYTREWRVDYISSAYKPEAAVQSGQLQYGADVPEGSALEFAVRGAQDAEGLEAAAWQAVQDGAFTLDSACKALQYKATLTSSNGDRYPVLKRVEIEVSP